MSHSTNTRSSYTSSKETLVIFPTTSPTLPYLKKSDLDNIHDDIKANTEKHHSDMKAFNRHLYAMLATLTDTSSKTENQ